MGDIRSEYINKLLGRTPISSTEDPPTATFIPVPQLPRHPIAFALIQLLLLFSSPVVAYAAKQRPQEGGATSPSSGTNKLIEAIIPATPTQPGISYTTMMSGLSGKPDAKIRLKESERRHHLSDKENLDGKGASILLKSDNLHKLIYSQTRFIFDISLSEGYSEEVLLKQLSWAQEIFLKELPKFFPLRLIEHSLAQKEFGVTFLSAGKLAELLGKTPASASGIRGYTRSNGHIYIVMDSDNTKRQLSQILTNEMSHVITRNSVVAKLTPKGLQAPKSSLMMPFLKPSTQIDQNKLKEYKSSIEAGKNVMERINWLAAHPDDHKVPAEAQKFRAHLLTYIKSNPYEPCVHSYFIDKKNYESTLEDLKKRFPTLQILSTTESGDQSVLKFRFAGEKAKPNELLAAMGADFNFLQFKLGSAGGYSGKSDTQLLHETMSDVDMMFPRGGIKNFIWEKLCKYMSDFHTAALAEHLRSEEDSRDSAPISYCT